MHTVLLNSERYFPNPFLGSPTIAGYLTHLSKPLFMNFANSLHSENLFFFLIAPIAE